MATILISTYSQKLEIIVKIEIISIEAVYREILMFKVNADLLFFENVHYSGEQYRRTRTKVIHGRSRVVTILIIITCLAV